MTTAPVDRLNWFRHITACKSALDLHSALARVAQACGFSASRVYSRVTCPIRERSYLTLIESTPAIASPVRVLDADYCAGERAKVWMWGPDNPYRNEAWVQQLGICGHDWIDLQLGSNGNDRGIWSVSRPHAPDELASEFAFLVEVALLAGQVLGVIQKERMLADLVPVEDEMVSVDRDTLLRKTLGAIGQRLGAQFVAYFQWEHDTGELAKIAEVGPTGDWRPSRDIDVRYRAGAKLTGTALIKDTYRYIPFFDYLLANDSGLADEASMRMHESAGHKPAHSVMYAVSTPPVGPTGLLRVINKSGSAEVPFLHEERELLMHFSRQFDSLLAVVTSAALFANLRNTLHSAMVTTTTPVQVSTDLNDTLKLLGVGPIKEYEQDAQGSQAGGRENFDGKEDWSVALPTRGGGSRQAIIKHSRIPVAGVASRLNYSSVTLQHVATLSLDILKHSVSLRNNSEIIRDAETAVGVIAHESRSPSVQLRSTANAMADVVVRSLAQLEDVKLNKAVRVNMQGGQATTALTNLAQLRAYCSARKRKIEAIDRQLARAISDGLIFARTRSDVVEVEFSEISLTDVLRVAAETVEVEAALHRKNLLLPQRPAPASDTLTGDKVLLVNLLSNLLDNAVKYSFSDTEIRVSARIEGASHVIEVENMGLGIHEDDLPFIFEPYYRARIRDARHPTRGVGLGLATCRRIAVIHAGTLQCVSQPAWGDTERLKLMEGYRTVFRVMLSRQLKSGRHNIMQPRQRDGAAPQN